MDAALPSKIKVFGWKLNLWGRFIHESNHDFNWSRASHTSGQCVLYHSSFPGGGFSLKPSYASLGSDEPRSFCWYWTFLWRHKLFALASYFSQLTAVTGFFFFFFFCERFGAFPVGAPSGEQWRKHPGQAQSDWSGGFLVQSKISFF